MKAAATLSPPGQAPEGGQALPALSLWVGARGGLHGTGTAPPPHSAQSVNHGSFTLGKPPALSGPQFPHE